MNLTLLLGSSDALAGFAPMDNALAQGAKVFRLKTVEGPTVTVQLVDPDTHVMDGITTLDGGDLFLNVAYNGTTVNGLNELQASEADFKGNTFNSSEEDDLTATDGSSKITFSFQVAGN